MSEWVFGFHAVVGALQHGAARVELVCIAEGVGGKRVDEVLSLARARRVRFSTVPRRELDRLAAGAAHNGFAARLAPAPLAAVEALLAQPAPVCLLGLDGIQDPRNLGAVIRVAAAFGVGGVVIAGPHPPPLGGATAKVAAGTLPLVSVARVGSLGDLARKAQERGFVVLGADVGGQPITAVAWPDRLLLCVGGEEGLRAKTSRFLDGLVAIPMDRRVESLNLAVACGILLWEWRRHWPWGPASACTQTP